jgi:hypothetical protein
MGARELERFSPVEFTAFRRASGEELGRLCVSLANWKGLPEGMDVWQPSEKDPDTTRAELARYKELLTNGPMEPGQLVTKNTHQELRKRVPSLDESIFDASVAAVKCEPSGSGGHFMTLELDQATGSALGVERNRLWQAMGALAGVPIENYGWNTFHPDVKIAYIPSNSMPDERLETLRQVIEGTARLLPLHLTAAELPTVRPQ